MFDLLNNLFAHQFVLLLFFWITTVVWKLNQECIKIFRTGTIHSFCEELQQFIAFIFCHRFILWLMIRQHQKYKWYKSELHYLILGDFIQQASLCELIIVTCYSYSDKVGLYIFWWAGRIDMCSFQTHRNLNPQFT